MHLSAPELMEHGTPQPGQFVMVGCEGFSLERPLGIASYDTETDTLLLVFAVVGGGTTWLSQRIVGDTIKLRGPFGNGFSGVDGKVLLIGGGLGLPPLLYTAKTFGNTDIAIGFRNKDAQLLVPEFIDACEHVVVATDDGSLGLHGNAIAAADKLCEKNNYTAVMACGPLPLLRAVKTWVTEKNIECYVSLEEHMACGVGACLVCACAAGDTYKRVCKDGPVFLAGDVTL